MGVIRQNGNVEEISFTEINNKIKNTFHMLGISPTTDNDIRRIQNITRDGTFDRCGNITEEDLSKEVDNFIDEMVLSKITYLTQWLNTRKNAGK